MTKDDGTCDATFDGLFVDLIVGRNEGRRLDTPVRVRFFHLEFGDEGKGENGGFRYKFHFRTLVEM